MLVLVHVSSMKTQRAGSIRPWRRIRCALRAPTAAPQSEFLAHTYIELVRSAGQQAAARFVYRLT
jgi:hypothetical protein